MVWVHYGQRDRVGVALGQPSHIGLKGTGLQRRYTERHGTGVGRGPDI